MPLRQGRNVIGRGSTADVRITDSGISREHAEVTTDGVLATITDLQSTNGTMVNGKRISRAPLRHGDVIRIGRSVLVYRYEPEGPR
ncbi:FHA domain-containing protein [Blastococcus sp. Marseille-P5729]|uniref:FHA domain-containing protein n=1 Tax=Blastococcus sp. Marseille-P5729 TaxID=2086582 RepID=UPI001F21694A|nr:FHA domain-containing protein [Blastococcus sp. Marseille-P5729]